VRHDPLVDDVWRLPEDPEDADFYRWYGAWDCLDPAGVAALMAGFGRPWWIVGGWSIEAFTGARREHEDVDLSILSCDAAAFREHLGSAWTPWSNDGGTLRPLSDRFPEPFGPETQIWVRRDAGSPWVVDVPMTPDQDGLWTSKRWAEHVVPLEEATWVAGDGIRYLNPEIALHFKARQLRPKDERDLETAWPLMSAGQRDWLLAALRATEPGHEWSTRLSP
jgi:hypothetical protein